MKFLSIMMLMLVFTSCQKQQQEAIDKAKRASIDSMQAEIKKQKIIDSMQLEIAKANEAQKLLEAKERRQNVTVVNQPAATQAPAKKKGWSGAAKGAVIGAGVGAATGAIVSKKKGEGAIIGGLVGAGVGAGTGAIIDDSTKNKKKDN